MNGGRIMIPADGEMTWNPWLLAAVGFVLGIIVGIVIAKMMKPAANAVIEPPEPAKPSGEPLRLLALLQRDGRLLDFLLEDVQAYNDAQIGSAVRDIHRACRKTLDEHLTLKPILAGEEGASVTVPSGFDPSAIRLTGNVTGQPPFTGTLRHHGWRANEVKLAKPPAGADPFVVQAAEVELG
jgi:hypothetical protein